MRCQNHPWGVIFRLAKSQERTEHEQIGIFCALIPNKMVGNALSNGSWDLTIGQGMPGCSLSYEGEKKIIKYDRYGHQQGIEPLVIQRGFSGNRNDYLEINEEFRLFHNLYHDKNNNEYIKIDNNGDEKIIIKVNPNLVQIQLKELRQFLAIREMHLAVYFDITRFSDYDINNLTAEEKDFEYSKDNIHYKFYASLDILKKFKSYSFLIGKKLIPPLPKEKSCFWPYSAPKVYEEFVIGLDENGDEITYSCNPDGLDNYFGKNPGAPHYYLTWVFFRRDVLSKYYSNPSKYEILDNTLRCRGLWSLRMDNNHRDYVIAYLGDLGRSLPHKEQLYWKSYNIPPDGKISSVTFRRHFLGEFANPEKADLYFKSLFGSFQRKWIKKYGWTLFKWLSDKDSHLYDTLRIPLTNDQAEFDDQVISLTKILIDSLNESDIEKEIAKSQTDWKGITKFEEFIKLKGLPDYKSHVKFLRDLQELRSTGAAHRKGKKYLRIAEVFAIGQKELRICFEDILQMAIKLLNSLDDYFLK